MEVGPRLVHEVRQGLALLPKPQHLLLGLQHTHLVLRWQQTVLQCTRAHTSPGQPSPGAALAGGSAHQPGPADGLQPADSVPGLQLRPPHDMRGQAGDLLQQLQARTLESCGSAAVGSWIKPCSDACTSRSSRLVAAGEVGPSPVTVPCAGPGLQAIAFCTSTSNGFTVFCSRLRRALVRLKALEPTVESSAMLAG